ncbi:hypothetical protein FE257_001573 [Aspergillus nanangensis]|uniref:Uncharacterized protein n=1 Tax=Aspergillus nanangensis TaxID=2582783 RepID=A0AAD4CTK0_ASPNN|nr:hypothetical protein FE257_001573 [Aspergillus nanangensis]
MPCEIAVKHNLATCESLLLAQTYLELWKPESLPKPDEFIADQIHGWASRAALPSVVFATNLDELSDTQNQAIRDDQLRSNLAVSVISLLANLRPIHKATNASDILLALASFTSQQDPWTTQEAYAVATALINGFISEAPAREFWICIEKILKQRIRPVFAKTRNPAITPAGRKDFHPIPLARFDASVLDSETKPWKVTDVYATTALSWIINQYQPKAKEFLETQFPLLVPPILALIDDDNPTFKTRGCTVFSQILLTIQDSNSDILQRTNLSSVFEDAIRPCLLSLPTITPEDEAIRLLTAAYPALLSLLKLNFLHPPRRSTSQQTASPQPTPKETYMGSLAKTLRDNLIPSFHHVSSTNTTSASAIPSYPYPRLSTLFLHHTCTIVQELAIHSTKYLQDIVPLIHATLSNPFGPAYPSLLFSSVAVTRAVILNAHPRLWRWRGDILGAVCTCFVHVADEEQEIGRREQRGGLSSADEATRGQMGQLKKQLQGAVYLLKLALENPVQGEGDAGQLEAKERLEKEIKELVEADETLRDLLMADVNGSEAVYFGVSN